VYCIVFNGALGWHLFHQKYQMYNINKTVKLKIVFRCQNWCQKFSVTARLENATNNAKKWPIDWWKKNNMRKCTKRLAMQILFWDKNTSFLCTTSLLLQE